MPASAGAPGDPAPALPRRTLPYAAWFLIVAGAYFVAGKLGLSLAAVHPSATAIWPGTGIAIASLLVLGNRLWPGVFAGAFLVNATTAGSPLTALGIATGNTLEAVVAAFLVGRLAGGRAALDRAADTFRYAGLVGVACALSATVGALSLSLTGFARWGETGPIWLTWWLGDLGGALVVAPFLLLWSRGPRLGLSGAQIGEALALIVGLVVMAWAVFRWVSPLSLGISLMFLCVPPLIWAAYRFDQRMAATAILALGALAVGGTLGRFGPAQRSELNQSLLVLQVFLGVMAVTALALAAVVAERRRADAAVRSTSDELREALIQLETFSHAISHDLRSPLGTVINFADIVEEDYGQRVGPDGLNLLQRIRTAAMSAARLLDQLAEFAWSGPDYGERREVDMTSVAREAYAQVTTGDDEVGGVRFVLHELPPALGSSALLLCVFRNLFSNSVKYTRGREHRTIEVSGVAGRTENTYIVNDNGIGFRDSNSEVLFQPFRRGTSARGYEGSGLGLAIAAKIIRKHGGGIRAESDGSTGARFLFTLKSGRGES